MGSWSDKIGRKPLYIGGTILMILYAFPYFWLLQQGSVTLMIIATVIGLGIIWAPITAVLGTMFSEIFKSNVRYTGITLGYQIGAAVAGGTAPLIATALLAEYDNSYVPVALYIIITSIISLIAVWVVRDRKNEVLDQDLNLCTTKVGRFLCTKELRLYLRIDTHSHSTRLSWANTSMVLSALCARFKTLFII